MPAPYGREHVWEALLRYCTSYKTQKKRVFLLYGAPGVGKTSLVHALAKELSFELFELNASDARNATSIEERLAPALLQASFFHAGKVILLDEVDGLSGSQDRGGVSSIVTLAQKSAFPLICTCNDISEDKLKPLLKIAQSVELLPLSSAQIFHLLELESAKKQYTISATLMRKVSVLSQGDVRNALTDLALVSSGDESLLVAHERTQTMQQVLRTVFKTRSASDALSALDSLAEDVDELLFWIDYNVAREYTDPHDIARAYGVISRADIFKSRIMRNQEWRFLVYVYALLGPGISLSKDAPYPTAIEYKQSTRALMIWQSNMKRAKQKVLASKLATKTHCSTKRAMEGVYVLKLLAKQPDKLEQMTREFDLDEEEITWLCA